MFLTQQITMTIKFKYNYYKTFDMTSILNTLKTSHKYVTSIFLVIYRLSNTATSVGKCNDYHVDVCTII